MPEEPAWYYELSEVVYQARTNNMQVPVLTIATLMKRGVTMYVPETEVIDTSGPPHEIDGSISINGDVFLLEATARNVVEQEASKERTRLGWFRHLAEGIKAQGVVFSTLSPEWSKATASRIEEAFKGSHLEIEILTQAELLK